MNVLGIVHPLINVAGRLSEEFGVDDDGHITTHSSIWPEKAEIIYGGLASIIIIAALVKFAGPQIKKAMAARTAKIQKELDDAAADKLSATTEAAQIRQAKGDIDAERTRILAEAEAQAAAVLEDGRARITAEIAELEAKAETDIIAARGRVGDELRAEIARLSSAAIDYVVEGSLDEATQQRLVEDFISRVGASTPATATSGSN